MTEQEVQAFCQNNGVSVSPPGQPLHVMDPTELPASVRAFVNDDGTYKGSNTPEAKDPRHEQSKGKPDANEDAVRKALGDSPEQAAAREAAVEPESTGKKGSLPKDFPHFKELEAAGITSYGKLRSLGGDYSSVSGIGPAKGAEIDAALGEE